MANQENIPSLIGSPRSARRSVHYIPTGEGEALQRAGEGIRKAGNALVSGMNAYAQYADEKNKAAFAKGYAEAEAEAARRVQEEVRSKVGFDAEGAARKTAQIYQEVGEKYRPQMQGQYRDQFDLSWGRVSQSQLRVSGDFELRNMRQAAAAASADSLKLNISRAGDSMDEAFQEANFASLKENYDRLYFMQNGGKRLPAEVLADLDSDMEKGFIKTRGGKQLRITEHESSGEGTISRKQADEIRSRWKVRAEAYEKGLTDKFDLAHANVIDRLIKADRVEECEIYMGSLTEKGYPISESTRTKLRKFISNAEKVVQDNAFAKGTVSDAVEKGGEPRYGSAEQDKAYSEALDRVKDNPEALALARRLYAETRRQQDLNLQADAISFAQENFWGEGPDGQKVAKPLSERYALVAKMPDSPLKDRFVESLRKEARAKENEIKASPEYQLESAKALSMFKESLRHGFYLGGRDGKTQMPLTNNQQIGDLINALGFTAADKKAAIEYVNDRKNFIGVRDVAGPLAKLLGRPLTQKDFDNAIPLLQRLLEDRRGGEALGSNSERARWMKENLTDILAQKVEYKTPWKLNDPDQPLSYVIKEEISPDRVYLDKEYAEAFFGAQDVARAVTGGYKPRSKEERDRSLLNTITPENRGKRFFLAPPKQGTQK